MSSNSLTGTTTTTTNPTPTPSPTNITAEISNWQFVDGNAAAGLNYASTLDAVMPNAVVFNSKLYLAWQEDGGSGVYQIRVKVYNGLDATPTWSFVDGAGTTGLNQVTTNVAKSPNLIIFNSKLYVAWFEYNGSAYQIRLKVYNGNDSSPSWSSVDGNGAGGINIAAGMNALNPQLTSFNGKLYCVWSEDAGSSTYLIQAKVYNSNDTSPVWTSVSGTGINLSSSRSAFYPSLAIVNSKLYATWEEDNGSSYQIRTSVYDGVDSSPNWTLVDGGAGNSVVNVNSAHGTNNPQVSVFNSQLYDVWSEDDGSGTYDIRLKVYNGNDSSPAWALGDSGVPVLNDSTSQSAATPVSAVVNSKLYLAWVENHGGVNQTFVGVYNITNAVPSFNLIEGHATSGNGINRSTALDATSPTLIAYNSKLYAIWGEKSSGGKYQMRVAVGQ